ncbi:MAG: hypothetical protein NWE98_01415 [Candidatus Bathyarchaeota archaeon]|nr:hypothetical protein [Candidatus Bathyarchaeota archaeon]
MAALDRSINVNREESTVNPQYSVSGITVSINLDSLHAERVGSQSGTEQLFFDINAKLEEQKKDNNQVTLNFNLTISTKPNVVKYLTAGSVTMVGKADEIKRKLEINPKTKIPQILFTIYQHVFGAIYLLSSTLNTPYPPPDLLHPMAEKIQIIPQMPPQQSTVEETVVAAAPAVAESSPAASAA